LSDRVGYLTKRFPRLSETFILDEILGLEAAGVPLVLIALAHPGEGLVQPDVSRVASPVTYLRPLGDWRRVLAAQGATLVAHGRLLIRDPRRYVGVVGCVARSRQRLPALRHFWQAGRLALLLEEAGVRHLHAAFAHGPASVAYFVHLLTGLPYSFAAHAKDVYLSTPDGVARTMSAAKFILACSESVAGALRGIAGHEGHKVVLALHGVDTTRFAPAASGQRAPGESGGPLRVLAVGRLVEKKGYPVLLDALATLVRSGRSISCTVIGTGPLKAEIEESITRLGLESVVSLRGARTHQEVAAAYTAADVFVHAGVVLANGDRDGIPNSLLEAMASGLPVIATAVAGVPEVVAPGCGLIVPPGDAAALASQLATLADDPRLRERLGSAARAHVVANLDRIVCARSIAALFGHRAPVPELAVAS